MHHFMFAIIRHTSGLTVVFQQGRDLVAVVSVDGFPSRATRHRFDTPQEAGRFTDALADAAVQGFAGEELEPNAALLRFVSTLDPTMKSPSKKLLGAVARLQPDALPPAGGESGAEG